MTVHVIVNPHRPEPNTTLDSEIRTRMKSVEVIKWDCIVDSNSAPRSINLSHKQIVQYAKDYNKKEICIMEEDVWFPAPDGLQYFLDNKPEEDFDLYLGGAYGLNGMALRRISKENGAAEIHNFAGLHCYIIRQRYYDKFLALPENEHIDNQPGFGVFYVCYPYAALQHPGWSANNRDSKVDYNRDISREHIYWGY